MKFPKFFKFWFPVILYSVIIFCLSSIPDLKAPPIDDNSDKVAHIGEYLILGFLLARALTHTQKNLSGLTIFWAAFLFCAFYGISDEIHQSLVPGRFSDWKDVLADTIGGFFGGWLYLFCFVMKNGRLYLLRSNILL